MTRGERRHSQHTLWMKALAGLMLALLLLFVVLHLTGRGLGSLHGH